MANNNSGGDGGREQGAQMEITAQEKATSVPLGRDASCETNRIIQLNGTNYLLFICLEPFPIEGEGGGRAAAPPLAVLPGTKRGTHVNEWLIAQGGEMC